MLWLHTEGKRTQMREEPPWWEDQANKVPRSGQSVADRKRGCRRPVLTGGLIEDVGEVIGHGFLTESQGMGDLAIALALGNQLEHRYLTLGQTNWMCCVCPTSWTRGKRAYPTEGMVG